MNEHSLNLHNMSLFVLQILHQIKKSDTACVVGEKCAVNHFNSSIQSTKVQKHASVPYSTPSKRDV